MSEAWDLAQAAAARADVAFRPMTTVDDADLINEVIEATWGGQHLDREVVRALAISGNVPIAAVADGAVIGFVLGWAGVDRDGLHVHSHMLAAFPDRRHAGVGTALKLAQRAQALDEGIHVMRWTFDPMIGRNAWLNFGKLGVVGDRFERSFYGEMADAINAGERSDRFVVRWDLDREPGPRTVAPGAVVAEVPIPAGYADMPPARRSEAREGVAVAVEAAFATGAVAATFRREDATYVFAREEDVS
jgi:predicted GNAT superfamily acetyltransferase